MSALEVEVGVGLCPERPEGFDHVWAGSLASGDARNPCRFCGTSGRAFFQRACAARTELFSGLRQPKSVTGWGKKAES